MNEKRKKNRYFDFCRPIRKISLKDLAENCCLKLVEMSEDVVKPKKLGAHHYAKHEQRVIFRS